VITERAYMARDIWMERERTEESAMETDREVERWGSGRM
jgi:hypothetical protein